MTHAVHVQPRRIFGDDCEECDQRAASVRGLVALDPNNIRRLADLAAEMKVGGFSGDPDDSPPDSSRADMKAVDNLRMAARVVFASGITEEVAG